MTGERRTALLLGLLVLVAGYFLYSRAGGLRSGASASGPRQSAGIGEVLGAQVVELDVAALESEGGTYRPGRDPFRYARPVARQPPPARPTPRRRPPPRQETPPVETQATPRPPAIDVVFLGSFGRADQRIAVFADDESIYNAMVGDVVKDVFRLVAIGYESVDLGFVDFPDAEPQRLAAGDS